MAADSLGPPDQTDKRSAWAALQGPPAIEALARAAREGERTLAEAVAELRRWLPVFATWTGDAAATYGRSLECVIRCAQIARIVRRGTSDVRAVCGVLKLQVPTPNPVWTFRRWVRKIILSSADWSGFAPGPAGACRLVEHFINRADERAEAAVEASATLIIPLARSGTELARLVELTVQRLPALPDEDDDDRNQLFCDPALHWSLRLRDDSIRALNDAHAFVLAGGPAVRALRWQARPYSGDMLEELYGDSIGAAFGLALWKLLPPADPEIAGRLSGVTLDEKVAATATLSRDGRLGPVGHAWEKAQAAARVSHYIVVCSAERVGHLRHAVVIDPCAASGGGGRPGGAPTLLDLVERLAEKQNRWWNPIRMYWLRSRPRPLARYALAALFVGGLLWVSAGRRPPAPPSPFPRPPASPSPVVRAAATAPPPATATPVPTRTPTPPATPTPTPTPQPTPTPSPWPTPTTTPLPTATATAAPVRSFKLSVTFPYTRGEFEVVAGAERIRYDVCPYVDGSSCRLTVTVRARQRPTSIEIRQDGRAVACGKPSTASPTDSFFDARPERCP